MVCGSVRPARRARRSSSSELRIAGVDGVMEASERGFVAWCLVALPPGSYSTPHQKSRELSRAGLMPKEIAGPARRQERGPPRRRPARRRGRRRRRPANSREQGGVSLTLASLRALLRQLSREEGHAPSFARKARSTPASAPRQNSGRPVLARSLEVASIRAAAIPPAVALPVSDNSGRAARALWKRHYR